MFPCTTRLGVTVLWVKLPALRKSAPASQRVRRELRTKRGDTRYQVRTANSERAGDGHLEVLADHITEGQSFLTGKVGN